MDNLDHRILTLLQENARRNNDELATMLDIEVDVLAKRIESMESSGVILKYTALVNEQVMDDVSQPIRALVELNISPERKTGYDAIASKIYQYPSVKAHFLVSGQFDYLVIVEGSTHQEIAHFVFDKLATLDNVTGTNSHFVLKKYKENGVVFEGAANDKRVAVMP
ncbi:Lrp/AsnC family transcriptional regulator [bacterium]|jgi:DNA-binding Lrp family transcriptional regulator|nr:Lrp/AsnC family transcriptional regulator [bacterium]